MMKYGQDSCINQLIKVEFPNVSDCDLDHFKKVLTVIEENKNPFLHKYISMRSLEKKL
jgi:hypothetical protein